MNANLKRYYLHNFLQALVTADGSFFTMAYFYFLGLPAIGVILATMIYGMTAYLMIRPIAWLTNKIGAKSTFFLHLIPFVAKYVITINVNPHRVYFVFIINFIHGINLMLYRIPVTAYFSRFGDNADRGKEISYINLIYGIVGIGFALFSGSLLDRNHFVLLITIQAIVLVISDFVLWSRTDPNLKLFVQTKITNQQVPSKVFKTYFIQDLPYTFYADLFFIWVTLKVGSFTLAGLFVGLKIALSILISYLVGYFSDRQKIRRVFYLTVLLTSIFYLFVPFVHNGVQIFILQFSIGLSGLIIDIPVEREYHNLAKSSGNEFSFSLTREKSGNLGMVIGGAVAIGLILIIKNWWWLFPLAILYPIGATFMLKKDLKASFLTPTERGQTAR